MLLKCNMLTFSILSSLVAQMVKSLLAVWETWVQFLGQEDPLEKKMATHSNILAWNIPWMEKPGALQSVSSQSQIQLKQLNTHHSNSCSAMVCSDYVKSNNFKVRACILYVFLIFL